MQENENKNKDDLTENEGEINNSSAEEQGLEAEIQAPKEESTDTDGESENGGNADGTQSSEQPQNQNPYAGYEWDRNNGGYNGSGYYPPMWAPPQAPKKDNKKAIIAICATVAAVLIIGMVAFGAFVVNYVLPRLEDFVVTPDDGEPEKPNENGSGGVPDGEDITWSDFVLPQSEAPGAPYASLSDAYDATYESFVEINTVSASGAGAGSGVIIGKMKDGTGYYILTNNHVVEDATAIAVNAKCGDSYKKYTACSQVLKDEMTDLAVIAIKETAELKVAKMGKSADVKVGSDIYVIGNPLGTLAGTLTDGIISAKEAKIVVGDHRMTLLQTTAAINPGNSGGPMFNMSGEVIGIINSKYTVVNSVPIDGIGFAIPIDTAVSIATQMITKGQVDGRHNLGVSVEYGSSGGVNGLWVASFEEDSALADALILQGVSISNQYLYRIDSINGETFTSTVSAYVYIDEQLKAGQNITVKVTYFDRFYGRGESKTVNFTLGQVKS